MTSVAVAGCGGDGTSAGPSTDGSTAKTGSPASSDGEKPELRVGIKSDFASLNPAKDSAAATQVVRALTNAPIIHVNPDGSFSAGGVALATSYRYVGEGNRTFEFELRPDAKFSDGTPVTPATVKKWLQYFPTANGPYASILQIGSIDTKGQTVTLHLDAPNPNVPWVLSEILNWGAVSSPKAVEKPKQLGTRTAGAGPYTLVPAESVTGNQYTLVPNEHYWDPGEVKFSKVTIKVVTNPSTMLQSVKTGELDVAMGEATTADAAEAAGMTVVWRPSTTNLVALLDREGKVSEPLADVRVRQAINYALDREAIAKGIFGEYATPASELRSADGFDESLANYYAYDPDKARSLLAEAGYADGFTLKLADTTLGDPVVQAMAKFLGDVGIKLDISTLTPAQYGTEGFSGDYPATQAPLAVNPMSYMYEVMLAPDAFANPFKVKDPVLEKLYSDALVAENPETAWKEMSRRIVTEAYFVPVLFEAGIYYVSDRIGGVDWQPPGFGPFATAWVPK